MSWWNWRSLCLSLRSQLFKWSRRSRWLWLSWWEANPELATTSHGVVFLERWPFALDLQLSWFWDWLPHQLQVPTNRRSCVSTQLWLGYSLLSCGRECLCQVGTPFTWFNMATIWETIAVSWVMRASTFWMASWLIGGHPFAFGGQLGRRVFSVNFMWPVPAWDGPGPPFAIEALITMLKA